MTKSNRDDSNRHPHPEQHEQIRRDAELLVKLDRYADDLENQVLKIKSFIEEELERVQAESGGQSTQPDLGAEEEGGAESS